MKGDLLYRTRNILRYFWCPDCKGDGGDVVPIFWKGMGGGPYEPCDTCGDIGKVNLFNFLYIWCLKIIGKW